MMDIGCCSTIDNIISSFVGADYYILGTMVIYTLYRKNTIDCGNFSDRFRPIARIVSKTKGFEMKKPLLYVEHLENRSLLTPIVAIVDSGIDLNHAYLKDNLWINPHERVDGIDNDNNGYVDDINGWDFVNNDNVPEDTFYHGTFVAGVTKSVDPNVRIMVLRFQNNSGLGYTGAAASAINYATKMKMSGVDVVSINLSWGGGTSSSLVLEGAIKNANNAGIVVVSATGNNGSDNDLIPRYPSSYKFSNSISVGAFDGGVSLASFSNYGKNSVEVAANGVGVYSSLPGNSYGYISGTSFAAPYVSGMVSLLKRIGNYSASQIKQSILNGCSFVGNLTGKVGYGLVNVGKSVEYISKLNPEAQAPIVINPPTPKPVDSVIRYGLDRVSKSLISGWARDSGNVANKLRVEVKINNRVVYSSVADGARNDTYSGSGFSTNLKRFFTKKKNLVEIRFIDAIHNKVTVGYSGIIRR